MILEETKDAEADRNIGPLIIIPILTGNRIRMDSLLARIASLHHISNHALMAVVVRINNQSLIPNQFHLYHNRELVRKEPCPILSNRVIL
jgi:hypothetical protein